MMNYECRMKSTPGTAKTPGEITPFVLDISLAMHIPTGFSSIGPKSYGTKIFRLLIPDFDSASTLKGDVTLNFRLSAFNF